MTDAAGEVRPQWHGLVSLLNRIGPEGLAVRWQEGRRLIHDNGVTYNVYGDPQSTDRPGRSIPYRSSCTARWWVLADRTQAPSGAGYALENRLVSGRVLPDLFRAENVRRLATFLSVLPRDAPQSGAETREPANRASHARSVQ